MTKPAVACTLKDGIITPQLGTDNAARLIKAAQTSAEGSIV